MEWKTKTLYNLDSRRLTTIPFRSSIAFRSFTAYKVAVLLLLHAMHANNDYYVHVLNVWYLNSALMMYCQDVHTFTFIIDRLAASSDATRRLILLPHSPPRRQAFAQLCACPSHPVARLWNGNSSSFVPSSTIQFSLAPFSFRSSRFRQRKETDLEVLVTFLFEGCKTGRMSLVVSLPLDWTYTFAIYFWWEGAFVMVTGMPL